jgi:hypothetical protein
MISTSQMNRVACLLLVVGVVGCTKPNPLDCSDGLCSEADHPFCDVDGSFAGTPNTCVAVSCTAGEPVACRGNVSIVCNSAGNNYELVECERGCDSSYGCRQCLTSAECANPSPICDEEAAACRGCRLDDECASKVCEGGSCAASSAVVYAAPNGADTGPCTLAEPCAVTRAIALAKMAAPSPTIRLLPGVYLSGLGIGGVSALPLRFVATGATISSLTAIAIGDGAAVEFRGVTAVGSNFSVNCSSSTATRSSITLRDSILRAGTGSANIVTLDHCDITLLATELDLGGSSGTGIGASSETQVIADRTRWHGAGPFTAGGFGTRINYRVSNSILENVGFIWATSDTTSPGSYVEMAFNTITQDGGGLNCVPNSGSTYRTRRFENNIIFSSNASSSVDGTDCMLNNNILYPFNAAAGSNIVADPRFVNAGMHDLHVQPGSPAIDTAMPNIIPPSADFDGTSRPQGPRSDIGALEYRP